MDDLSRAAQQVASFLKALTTTGGMRLKYRITAGPGAADPDGLERREIYVEMAGPDAPLLTDRGGELLRALEHVAAAILRLDENDQELVSFDANSFKATRARRTRLFAETAAENVRLSGRPYALPPMSSGERRMLHVALRRYDGLRTESSGEGRDRCLVVYPASYQGPPLQAAHRGSSYPRAGDPRGVGSREGAGRDRDRSGRDSGFNRR